MPDLTWLLPDEPLPVRLMNTVWADRTGVHDALMTPADLRSWLADTGSAPARSRVDQADLERSRALRDALRRLASTVVRDARPAAASAVAEIDEAVAIVNRTVAAHAPVPKLVRRGRVLHRDENSSGTQVSAALTRVALEAIDLLSARPTGLRACNAPGCVLYFVKDHPRRTWCSTACGNRARAARHYRRHHLGE